jgi:molybdopterin synthase sulfur carrier subunit
MAHVRLRAPLKERAGGEAKHDVPGATVGEVLRTLEGRHPKITGWMLDDHGRVRRNVNVYVNGEPAREDVALAPDDDLQVLPSIAGGMT